MRALIVREPFGDYAKGQAITKPEDIAAVEKAGQSHFCTPTDIDESFFQADEPQSAPAPAKPVLVAPPPAAAPQPTPPAAPAAPSA